MIKWLRQHRSSWYLRANSLDGIAVRIPADENDACLACPAKPPGNFNPFAASFEIDVPQDNIGPIAHSQPAGAFSVCCQIAKVETERTHIRCETMM
jgi:hypothetical protein